LKQVLIVSPHFPPVDLPDMHRVRISLPYFQEFGWKPTVLTVAPRFVEGSREPRFADQLATDTAVTRTSALPVRWTRKAGLGNLGLRAFPFLYSAGSRLFSRGAFDLVYFSTTVFTSIPLGKLWKRRFGIPFVVDMQDPWVNDYYDRHPSVEKPPKYRIANSLHHILEPWSMPAADGLISVSAAYIEALAERYPALRRKPSMVLPFGAAPRDFEGVRQDPQPNGFFDPADGQIHAVYIGRGGQDMWTALGLLFSALKTGLNESPELFQRIRMHFLGTDYAPAGRSRKSIEPLAESLGVAEYVREHPERVPYFEALQVLRDAHMLLLPGSDDPQYTPSKLYPYILAGKPLLAILHESSGACDVMRSTNAGAVVAFGRSKDQSGGLYRTWREILGHLNHPPQTDWWAFEKFTAREMTRRQCELFDRVCNETVRGADPLVRAGRPRPALLSKNQVAASPDKPTRGSAADQGVRPTTRSAVLHRDSQYLSISGH
jgi:glycosyltransferase involved in cell wall biosynthesis